MRLLFVCLVILSCKTMPASASDLDVEFLIKREGKVIGYHRVDVRQEGGVTAVRTEIKIKVKFGPIALYRYSHQNNEVWRNGALLNMASQTNDNGAESWMRANRVGGLLMIDGSGFQGAAPDDAAPSSYWNKTVVSADRIINTQTGEIIDIETSSYGQTTTPQGRLAEHYRVEGTLVLDVWYDDDRWVASNFVIDGEELEYELVEPQRKYAGVDELLN